MVRLFAAALLLVASAAGAQNADWTRVAPTLRALNAQILDWAAEYQKLASSEPTPEVLASVVILHFQRGPVVAGGLNARFEDWKSASETQKKSRYLAISRYFATHSDDWGSSSAWNWYLCLTPPLDARYNNAAADAGAPAVPEAQPLPVDLIGDRKRRLLDLTLPTITRFLALYDYPIVDTPITRLSFEGYGLLLDGRPPRDRLLLNKTFTYDGSQVGLFGPGF